MTFGTEGDLYFIGTTLRNDLRIGTPAQSAPKSLDLSGHTRAYAMAACLNLDGSPRFVFYPGGSGPSLDLAQTLVVDPEGYCYIVGQATSRDFPVSNPIRDSASRQGDVYVIKLSPNGEQVVYSTLLGGSLLDQPLAIGVNREGELFIAGLTWSEDFPVFAAPVLRAPTSRSGDAFIAKISSNGELLFSQRFASISWNIRAVLPDSKGGVRLLNSPPLQPTSTGAIVPGTFPNTIRSEDFLIHFDSAGHAISSSVLEGKGESDLETAIELPEGDILIAGASDAELFSGASAPFGGMKTNIPKTAILARVSEDGRLVRWVRRVATTENSSIRRLLLLPDGSLAALCELNLEAPASNDALIKAVVLRIDPLDGTSLSVTEVPGMTCSALSMQRLSNGKIRVGGTAYPPENTSRYFRTLDLLTSDIGLDAGLPHLGIRWIFPYDGLPEFGPKSIPYKLSLQDWFGEVRHVDIYDDGVGIASWEHPPFTFPLSYVHGKPHHLQLVITDNQLTRHLVATYDYAPTVLPISDRLDTRLEIPPDGSDIIGSLLGCVDPLRPRSPYERCYNSAWFEWTPQVETSAHWDIESLAVPRMDELRVDFFETTTESPLRVVFQNFNNPLTSGSFFARAGHHYLVHVTAENLGENFPPDNNLPGVDRQGIFRLRIGPGHPPSNARRETALELSGEFIQVKGTTIEATLESNGPGVPSTELPNHVWYTWAAPHEGTYLLRVTPDRDTPLRMELRDENGVQIHLPDGVTNGVVVSAVSDQKYQVLIRTDTPGTDFQLSISPVSLGTKASAVVTGTRWTTTVNNYPTVPPVNQVLHIWNWTAPESGAFRIRAEGAFRDATLYIKTSPTTAYILKSATSETIATNSLNGRIDLVLGAEAGAKYVITFSNENSLFDVTLSCEPYLEVPRNDRFQDAIDWPENDFSIGGSTRGASSELDEPLTTHPQETVWYSWISKTNALWAISSESDTCLVASLYQGESIQALSLITTNRSDNRLTFESKSGTRYYLQISSLCSREAIDSFSLSRRTIISNETFNTAVPLLGSSPQLEVTLSSTGLGWWNWTPPSNGLYRFHLNGTTSIPTLDLAPAVTRLPLIPLSPIFVFSDSNRFSMDATYLLNGNKHYLMSIGGGYDSSLSLLIEPVAPSLNSKVVDRIPIQGEDVTFEASMLGLTPASDVFQGYFLPSLWWSWVPPKNGFYRLSSAGSDFAVTQIILDGPSLPGIFPRATDLTISHNYPTIFRAELNREVVFGFTPGSPSMGTGLRFAISPVPLPENDSFEKAALLDSSDAVVTGVLKSATIEPGEPGNWNPLIAGSAWYEWTPPTAGTYYVENQLLFASDLSIALYSGENFLQLSPLTPAPLGRGEHAFLQLNGKIKIQVVGNPSVAENPFKLTLQQYVVAHDMFHDPLLLFGSEGTVDFQLRGSTIEPNEPIPQKRGAEAYTNSVWFTFNSLFPNTIQLKTPARDRLSIRVYRGSRWDNLKAVSTATQKIGNVEVTSFVADDRLPSRVQVSGPNSLLASTMFWTARIPEPQSDFLSSFQLEQNPADPSKMEIRLNALAHLDELALVEQSTNLIHWIPLSTNRNVGIPFEMILPFETAEPQQFFRIRLLY